MRQYGWFLVASGAALLALGGALTFYRVRTAPLPDAPWEAVKSAPQSAGDIHARGPDKASVTIEEFGDFECLPCSVLTRVLEQVETDRNPKLRVVFRHHPLAMHPHAQAAAFAAEAAGLQGKFWEMHDLLYREQNTWGREHDVRSAFENYARALGLDVDRFRKDSESNEVKARVAADQERGTQLGVTSTPTLFINDWVVPRSSYSVDGLRARIGMMEATVNTKSSL